MAKSNKIRLTLKGPGVSYTSNISPATAGQILSMAMSTTDGDEQNSVDTTRISVKNNESIAEYLNRHAPRQIPEKIAIFAAYLREHNKKTNFHPNEVKVMFREAGESYPGNFARDFRIAVKRGWLAQDRTKPGTYYLTNSATQQLRKMNSKVESNG